LLHSLGVYYIVLWFITGSLSAGMFRIVYNVVCRYYDTLFCLFSTYFFYVCLYTVCWLSCRHFCSILSFTFYIYSFAFYCHRELASSLP